MANYVITSIFQFFKIAAMEFEIYPRLFFYWQHSFSNVQIYLHTKFQ